MTGRRTEWNGPKLHGGSARGLIISNIPYCDDSAIEGSQLRCAVKRGRSTSLRRTLIL